MGEKEKWNRYTVYVLFKVGLERRNGCGPRFHTPDLEEAKKWAEQQARETGKPYRVWDWKKQDWIGDAT